jgi:CRP-like cAMP-binding protein
MAADSQMYERFGRSYPTGTVLFREGEPGHEMYVLQSGRIQLTRTIKHEEKIVAVLMPGEFFGEMSIVNNRPRSATATVIEDAKMLVIDSRTFEAMIRGNAEIAVRLIKKLTNRLEQANQQIEILLLRDSSHRIVHALRRLAETVGHPEAAGIRIDISEAELADRVGMTDAEVAEVIAQLAEARLVTPVANAERGFVVAEVGKLVDFIEFLEMKEKYGTPT